MLNYHALSHAEQKLKSSKSEKDGSLLDSRSCEAFFISALVTAFNTASITTLLLLLLMMMMMIMI